MNLVFRHAFQAHTVTPRTEKCHAFAFAFENDLHVFVCSVVCFLVATRFLLWFFVLMHMHNPLLKVFCERRNVNLLSGVLIVGSEKNTRAFLQNPYGCFWVMPQSRVFPVCIWFLISGVCTVQAQGVVHPFTPNSQTGNICNRDRDKELLVLFVCSDSKQDFSTERSFASCLTLIPSDR